MSEIAAPQLVARRRGLGEGWFAWVLIAPAVAFTAVIVAWPLLETIRLSFTDADTGGENWVGLANYEKLHNSQKFYEIVGRTFFWLILSVSLKLIVGLFGATLLAAAVPGRALIMPPWVIPIAIGCLAWLWLCNGQFGFLSGMGQRVGILGGPFEFLAYKNSAFYSAIVTDVWVGTPMVSLFFLAAMQGVSRDLYEAAWVNAGRVEQFGSPMEMYHHPATKFVAQFIGQPNVNLIQAKVLGTEAGGLAVELDGGTRLVLPVAPGSAKNGDHVEVGIRPENVALGQGISMKVRVLERLGGIAITYGNLPNGQRFCAALHGDATVKEGETISLSVNPADCHVFDASGVVLRRQKAPALAA